MNYEYFIARKVATGQKKSFTRLIIRIAIIAIALSMSVMICSSALIAGFKQEISEKIFGFWGHIHITGSSIYQAVVENDPINKQQDFYPNLLEEERITYLDRGTFMGREYVREQQTRGGVSHLQVFALRSGIIQANEEIEGIVLKGAGEDFNWTFMEDYLREGALLSWQDSVVSNGILISQQTADRLRLSVEDPLRVVFVENEEPIQRRFVVKGIFKTGLEEYDSRFALVDIRKIQQLMGWTENQVGGFEVFIDDIDDLDPIANHIYYNVLPEDLYAETIEEKFREIFQWLALQDINEVVIMGLMIIVAIINMITALLILILERTNMIGTLKALGSSNWGIRKIFLYYASYIIILGIFWGNLIGLLLCFLQDKFRFITLDEQNYYLDYAPVEVDFWTILLLNLGTLLVVLLFLIIPSYLVTRISPIRAIRFR
ncbi:MAG TPA: FtsX-like permease family protein [Saprospiraceae bacterium]|nr:FtsX-like permease family protein [Saprospiraceae bacterium]